VVIYTNRVISGFGIMGFRDPHGIRPLVLGERKSIGPQSGMDYMFSSESVALDQLEFINHITIAPGMDGIKFAHIYA
jgi:amidophosphoribosyltransferase